MEKSKASKFYIIVDEDDGLYVVYTDDLTVELITKGDVAAAAKLFGVTVEPGDDTKFLFDVAGKLALSDPSVPGAIEEFLALGTGWPLCLKLQNPINLIVGRGDRVASRGDRARPKRKR